MENKKNLDKKILKREKIYTLISYLMRKKYSHPAFNIYVCILFFISVTHTLLSVLVGFK